MERGENGRGLEEKRKRSSVLMVCKDIMYEFRV
jgi:hypothetical protein